CLGDCLNNITFIKKIFLSIKILLNRSKYLGLLYDETQFTNPLSSEYTFDDNIGDKTADYNDIYDEYIPVLPGFNVHKNGVDIGFTKVMYIFVYNKLCTIISVIPKRPPQFWPILIRLLLDSLSEIGICSGFNTLIQTEQFVPGPTFGCRVLTPEHDGIASNTTNPSCLLKEPGISADNKCRCTYEITERDDRGCALNYVYTCTPR
uniref:VWFD domain-containing protein n=1 Tax=Syphacia muris TaxID=451379 RepID=A0A0N5B0Y4_9BILA